MHKIRLLSEKLAGEEGLEPSLPGPEPGVLPLDYSPATDVTESKSRRFPGVVNGIIPLNLPLKEPQKRAGEGLQIQSLLSNPSIAQFESIMKVTRLRIMSSGNAAWQRAQLLKLTNNQIKSAPKLGLGYDSLTDDANETFAIATLRFFMAPSTLPETVVEVVL